MTTTSPPARTAPDAIYAEARTWFEANWSPDLTLGEWWQRLADSGWGFPHWPERWYGKGLASPAAKAVHRARMDVGAFSAPSGIATMMVAPTLAEVGTPAQQERFIPPIANGTEVWCQLFSEPGAGSDLAGVQTRAVRDGDEWVVNGQKVWTSGGHFARWAILLARTDPDVPKRRGLTFFRRDTALRLPGPGGTLTGADAPLDGRVADMALMTPGMSIAGGTDEIQRNILGERHLGLPPEPRVDKDVPFRELRQGTVRT